MINFFAYPIKPELFWAILAVIVGFIALLYEILHHRALKRLQKKIDDPFSKGLKLMAEGKWGEAIGEFREAMKEVKAIYLVNCCNLIGLCYYSLDELDSAFESYNLSLGLAKNFNDKKGEAVASNHVGLIFKNRGETKKALRHFEDALTIFTQIGAQREIKIAKRNIQELKSK